MNTISRLLGNISFEKFLTEYWHKKPLLIRQAIPNFTPLLSKQELFDLAGNEDVESRFISVKNKQWQVDHGPLTSLPSSDESHWTVLIQGVNLYNDAANHLMEQFRFIPDSRLDDLMISYATDQGGVGPHFDSYDVFLLQAEGQRRWRIGAQTDMTLVENVPLKILKDFQYTEEYVLNPGDMLYLPPQYAHDGVALGECMTYSIGFRAPTYQELAEEFLHFMAESIDLPGRYADPELQYSNHPGDIPDQMVDNLQQAIQQIQFSKEDVTLFLGRYLSEPKNNVFFDDQDHCLDYEAFITAATKYGINLSKRSRLIYKDHYLFMNGEDFEMDDKDDQRILTTFSNHHHLSGAEILTASEDVKETLYQWYQGQWIVLSIE